MNISSVGDVIKISKGKKVDSVSSVQTQNNFRYIQIDDLRNDNNLKYTADNGVQVTEEDVIIAWDGANAGTIGYGLNGIIGSTLAKLEIIDKSITPEYLGRFLQTKFAYLRQYCTGATIPHVSRDVLTGIKIPVLSIDEQKEITEKADIADNLRQKRKQAIDLLNEYLNSVFLEMFGDPLDNPQKFDVVKLSTAYVNDKDGTKCGPFGSALKKEEYVGKGVPVWTMDNIQEMEFVPEHSLFITKEKFNELAKYQVMTDDIIISRAGTVGKMAVVNYQQGPSIISTNLIRLRLNKDKLLPTYFVRLMTYCKGRVGRLRTGKDGTFTHMNTGILDNLAFPLPPMDLQQKYMRVIKEAENLKQKMLRQSEELDNQFNALMQKHFNSN